jgi:hypothetical protein
LVPGAEKPVDAVWPVEGDAVPDRKSNPIHFGKSPLIVTKSRNMKASTPKTNAVCENCGTVEVAALRIACPAGIGCF